jgi:mono/diheme cytochrome c family protein
MGPSLAQTAAIALTAVVALASSAALAWSLRARREAPGPLPDAPADRQAALLGAGRLAYQVHCLRCHGPEGHGDGSDAERLTPPPRDFASRQWRFAPAPDPVRQAIVAGIPGTAMPGWGSTLSRRELEGLVAYVLAMAPTNPPRPEESQPAPRTRAGFTLLEPPQLAPPMDIVDLDGKPASLAQRRGHPLLVVFWGTTCAVCLSEMPAVIRFAERHREEGLEVLRVCVDETDAAVVRSVAGPQPSHGKLYIDPSGGVRHRYDVQNLPAAVLIDGAGRIIARAEGARDWNDPALDALIRECLTPENGHAARADRRPG